MNNYQNKLSLSYRGGFKQKTLSHKTEAQRILTLTKNVNLAFNGGTKYFQEIKSQNAPLIGGGYERFTTQKLSKWEEQKQSYETYREIINTRTMTMK